MSVSANRTKSIGTPSIAGACFVMAQTGVTTNIRTSAPIRRAPKTHDETARAEFTRGSYADQFGPLERIAQNADRRDIDHSTIDRHRPESRRLGLGIRGRELARALNLLARRRE